MRYLLLYFGLMFPASVLAIFIGLRILKAPTPVRALLTYSLMVGAVNLLAFEMLYGLHPLFAGVALGYVYRTIGRAPWTATILMPILIQGLSLVGDFFASQVYHWLNLTVSPLELPMGARLLLGWVSQICLLLVAAYFLVKRPTGKKLDGHVLQ